MKYVILLLAILYCGCKKSATEESSGTQLLRIESSGKVNQCFTYNEDGLLVKKDWFSGCDRTPMDEFSYTYTGTRLDSIVSVRRSLYSSTAALCDPATGIRSYALVGYDNEGRVSTLTQENGNISTFEYNPQGFIVRQTIDSGTPDRYITTYKRDATGNIIEVTDGQGSKMQYEFDKAANPYFRMKKHPDVITAFSNSPNNVVKITSVSHTATIQYEYNQAGLPAKMFDNGSVYEFVYH